MQKNLAYGVPPEKLDILCVDDNVFMQRILRNILKPLGLQRLRIFDQPNDALASAMASPPNLAIIDWVLDRQTADNLIRHIRAPSVEPLSFLPIIVITGHATKNVFDAAIVAGASTFLAKPFSADGLLRRIEWVSKDERLFVLCGESYIIVENDDTATQMINETQSDVSNVHKL